VQPLGTRGPLPPPVLPPARLPVGRRDRCWVPAPSLLPKVPWYLYCCGAPRVNGPTRSLTCSVWCSCPTAAAELGLVWCLRKIICCAILEHNLRAGPGSLYHLGAFFWFCHCCDRWSEVAACSTLVRLISERLSVARAGACWRGGVGTERGQRECACVSLGAYGLGVRHCAARQCRPWLCRGWAWPVGHVCQSCQLCSGRHGGLATASRHAGHGLGCVCWRCWWCHVAGLL
jgi:hypothetical protein